jgi:hypothetical protein
LDENDIAVLYLVSNESGGEKNKESEKNLSDPRACWARNKADIGGINK